MAKENLSKNFVTFANTDFEPKAVKKNLKDDFADANPGQVNDLKMERALCLDSHDKSKFGGNNEVWACDNIIEIAGQKIDPEKYVAISVTELMTLFRNSSALRTDSSDILALKMILGANDTDKTMHIFFQPVSLILTSELFDASLQYQGIFVVGKSGPVYDYTSNGFTLAPETTYTEYYRNNVKTLLNGVDGRQPFTPGINVESVLFSFQEIFNFIYENKLPEVKVLNCIRSFNTIEKGLVYKHSLIIAKDLPSITNFGIDMHGNTYAHFNGAYCNLTHLCPPNCSRIIHPLEKLAF